MIVYSEQGEESPKDFLPLPKIAKNFSNSFFVNK